MPVTVIRRRAGKNGRMQVNGVILLARLWEVTETAGEIDDTNFDNASFESGTVGTLGLRIRFELLWNAAAVPLQEPAGLYPRADLADVKLYENVADAQFWWLPLARVLDCVNGVPVRGIITYTGSLKNQGVYIRPEQTVVE
jgi:hypothetical protein